MKKIDLLMLILLVMLSMNTSFSYAQSYDLPYENVDVIHPPTLSVHSYFEFNPIKDGLEPMTVDACPGRGNHLMSSRGWGGLIRVYPDGTREDVFRGGACWQCIYCKEVLVSEYDPLRVEYVGYYAMRNPGYIIPGYGITMEAPDRAIRYTSASRVPYCILQYN